MRKVMIIAFMVQKPAVRKTDTNAWATQGKSPLKGKLCVPNYYGEWVGVAIQAVSDWLFPKQMWPSYYGPTFPLA